MEKIMIKSDIPALISDSYHYKSEKGEISLVYPSRITMGLYEIYCIEGKLFKGVERCSTLEGSEQRINELLLNSEQVLLK